MTNTNPKLKRVWTPSGSYSSGSKKRLIVIHTMEGFTGANGAKDCAIYFQGNVGASSQVCIDNNRGTIWEGVARQYGAWTQCNFNGVSVSAEQSGYASWSTDYWMTNRLNQLHNMADYIAEESAALGIPITLLTDSQAQGGSAGVTFHSRLGSAGCGHSDPGSNWPVNQVLDWARGSSSSSATGDIDMSVSAAIAPDGSTHHVCIRESDGKLLYWPPGWANWGVIDPAQSGAKGGASIIIDDDYWVSLYYTNAGGAPCRYRKKWLEGAWGWSAIGDVAKALIPAGPNTAVNLKGVDYSWDHPDFDCLKGQGVVFIVRYGSRDPSKNLTKSELDSALSKGLKVCVVWQEGKTQMLRGYNGGQTDARDADAFVNGLGLNGIPVYFSCDQDWEIASSSDKAAIDAYCDGAKSIVGKARMGGYGDDTFCKRMLDTGRITYAWQTLAWSEGAWESRAQLRQVKNNQSVCGGLIDWDEAKFADYGQWPRP